MLVSSPLRRALQTTLIGFQPEVQRGLKVVALPDVQETSDLPCDTGSDPTTLEKEFGEESKVDLSLLTEGWNMKVGNLKNRTFSLDGHSQSIIRRASISLTMIMCNFIDW